MEGEAEACGCGQYSAGRWGRRGQNVARCCNRFGTVHMSLVALLESCCTSRWSTCEVLDVVDYGASWYGFQCLSHALSPTHDHHVKQPNEGWYGWLMIFYSIDCSSRREDGILCLQLFLDCLQACQWQWLTIDFILVDRSSQTHRIFCTSCRKHVCSALYASLN